MGSLCCFLLGVSALAGNGGSSATELSRLYQPAFRMDHELREPAEPYRPQPGDILLCTDHLLWAKFGHWAAGTGAPQHSGIVFALPDGRMALLEGGPHNSVRCEILDLIPELQSYAVAERVWIRRRSVPLTAEQSARLTAFALKVEGKPFAVFRLLGQLTPFRSRGPLRTQFVGGPRGGERWGYFCSELVAEACVAAGLFDPVTTRPAATYPRDLFFGRSRNAYIDQHLDMSAWFPPARWTPGPGVAVNTLPRYQYLDGDTTSSASP